MLPGLPLLGPPRRVLRALAEELYEPGEHRPDRVLCRRYVRGREKGAAYVGTTKRGKGTKIMAIADRLGLSVHWNCAGISPIEITLVEETIDNGFLADAPARLMGDRA